MHLPKLTDTLLSSGDRLNCLEHMANQNQLALNQIAKTLKDTHQGRRWSLGLGVSGLIIAGVSGVVTPTVALAYWPLGVAILSIALILRR